MARRKLKQFKGRLSPAQIADGMTAAAKNARQLAEAASLLLEKGLTPIAAALAALSIEESGKIGILRGIAIARDDEELAMCWREFRTHTRKNVLWVLRQHVEAGARRLADMRVLFDEKVEHPVLLDLVKQISLYTDCLGNAHWSIPAEVIDKDLASELVKTAHWFPHLQKEAYDVVEIELYAELVGSAWKLCKDVSDVALIEEILHEALLDFIKALNDRGIEQHGIDFVREFLRCALTADFEGANPKSE